MASFGIGGSLAGYGPSGKAGTSLESAGISEEQNASAELGAAAGIETQRNAQNTVAKAQAQQGDEQLGATAGALAGAEWGSAIGPWGTVIGGVLGAVAGRFF